MIVAVPEFVVSLSATKFATLFAVAVAPDDTIRSSPVAKSVIVSEPESTLKESLPPPPVNVSFPVPPVILSAPAPPVILSAPAPPVIVSAPFEPVIISAPELPVIVNPSVCPVRTTVDPLVCVATVSYTHLTLPTT